MHAWTKCTQVHCMHGYDRSDSFVVCFVRKTYLTNVTLIFFVRARCLSAGLRSWILLADQRGIEPPPAVCQRRQERRDTNWATRTTLTNVTLNHACIASKTACLASTHPGHTVAGSRCMLQNFETLWRQNRVAPLHAQHKLAIFFPSLVWPIRSEAQSLHEKKQVKITSTWTRGHVGWQIKTTNRNNKPKPQRAKRPPYREQLRGSG